MERFNYVQMERDGEQVTDTRPSRIYAYVGDADKIRENRVRRIAARRGYRLVKSRRRDPQAIDYGSFWLIRADMNLTVVGDMYGVSLDVIEAYLEEA